jgi:hypothetical protein
MRALLLTLALLNLLFLGWATLIDVPVAGGSSASALPRLEVLSAGAPATPQAPAPDGAQRCAAFGPLPDEAAASAVQAALAARRLNGTLRHVVAEELEGYQVTIGELGNEVARRRALQRLEKAGVHGAEVIAGTGQVSAGLFADQAAADRRIAAVKAAGYKASSQPSRRLATHHFLDVQLPLDMPLPAVDALTAGVSLPEPAQWGACPAAPSPGT